MKRIMYYLYIGLVGILAFVFLLWITPYGSGVSPDSVVYLEVAKNLLSGKGGVVSGAVVTHYPPLYSIFLAIGGLFISDFVQAARIINALLFGLNVILVGLVVFFAVEQDFLASVLATLVFFFSAPLIALHSMAWSEPLFLTFSLISIYFLSAYIKKPTFTLMIIASISLGLALITRYIGIALIPAALAVVFFKDADRKLGNRLWDTILFLLLVCAPLAIVLARNELITGSGTNRDLVFHPVSFLHVKAFVDTLFAFLLPVIIPFWIKLATVVFISFFFVIGMALILKQSHGGFNKYSHSVILSTSSLWLSVSYSIFLIVSISFFDARTPIDERLLAPVFVFLIISTWGIAWKLSKILRKAAVWYLFLFLVAFTTIIRTPYGIYRSTIIQKNGQGYTSSKWQESESIAFVKTIAVDVKLYTNGVDAIGFLSGKHSIRIPYKTFPTTLEPNTHFKEEVTTMCAKLKEEKALLVYFTTIDREFLPTQDELESTCQINSSMRYKDGLIYGGW